MEEKQKNLELQEKFLQECRETLTEIHNEFCKISKTPHEEERNQFIKDILQKLLQIQNIAVFMGYKKLAKLLYSWSQIFENLHEGQIKYSSRFEKLVEIIEEKLEECLALIKNAQSDKEMNISDILVFCDKLIAGEIVFFTGYEEEEKQEIFSDPEDEKFFSKINSVDIKINDIDSLITKNHKLLNLELKIKKQIENLSEQIPAENREMNVLLKQVRSDFSAMENTSLEILGGMDFLKMLPIDYSVQIVNKKLIEIAKQHKKEFNFVTNTEGVFCAKDIIPNLATLIEILVKNALFHGIEDAETRVKNGKNPKGTITLTAKQNLHGLHLEIADDGQSFDFEDVRKNALNSMPEKREEILKATERELETYIFKSELNANYKNEFFSSKEKGMDYALLLTEHLKGHIRIKAQKGKGSTVTIDIPNSMSVRQGLFVISDGKKLFVTNHHLIDVISKWKSELPTLHYKMFLKFQGQDIPVYKLSDLLREDKANESREIKSANNSDLLNILIVEYMETRIGIVVDEISNFAHVAITPLGTSFKKFRELQGLVLDEEFNYVPVLYIPEIINKFKSLRPFESKKIEADTKNDKPKILIADDSKTAREIEGTILQANGFRVEEAEDGIEAIEKLKEKSFNLIISDTDMPRMNGLILLENLRRMEKYKNTPVIIITSSQDESVKNAYSHAGANSFIAKENFKRGDLINLVKKLLK